MVPRANLCGKELGLLLGQDFGTWTKAGSEGPLIRSLHAFWDWDSGL